MEPPSIIFKVKPAYLPSFLMALLGALCQYVVFGTARLISEAQKQNPANPASQTALALQGVAGKDSGEGAHLAGDAQQPSGAVSAAVQPPANSSKISVEFFRLKEHLAPIFIGPAYSNILSVLLKGILAFFVAGIMKDPNLFGITVDKGNFYGFFTLGVFFGFWPLEKLLQKFAEIAGINTPQSQLPDKGTAGTQPAVSGG